MSFNTSKCLLILLSSELLVYNFTSLHTCSLENILRLIKNLCFFSNLRSDEHFLEVVFGGFGNGIRAVYYGTNKWSDSNQICYLSKFTES